MKTVIRKVFFAWDADKEQEFLEKKALEGLKLVEVALFKYTFEKFSPETLSYQMEFRSFDNMSEDEFLQLYEDAGWNLAARMGMWYYFSSSNTKENDVSVFNTNESEKQKYKRLLFFLFLTGFPVYANLMFMYNINRVSDMGSFYSGLSFAMLPIALIHLFALIKIFIKYKQLLNTYKE